ncbi:MAG: hypothetical protein EPN82_02275 [Bacteroidetes bacterium]|nr:MAG: hypothetical protein EPN82_02275 [Bacteroidota bacterium]
MKNLFIKAILGGILATAVMTSVMFIAPMMGIPKMNPAAMLSGMIGVPSIVGWLMHFMIGAIFAIVYALINLNVLEKINNKIIKGAIFGLAIFVFTQITMIMMGFIFNMPKMSGSILLTMIGSILGHVVYGIVVALILKESREHLLQTALS